MVFRTRKLGSFFPVSISDRYLMPHLKHLEAQWIARGKSADAKNSSAGEQKSKETR
jgi:hypothetical protein